MKTNELIEELEAMAYKPEFMIKIAGSEILSIKRASTGLIAIVDKNREMAIDTVYAGFRTLSYVEKHNLYSLLTEYARTPLEEREEEKKYIYRLPVKNLISEDNYLLRYSDTEVRFDSSSPLHVLKNAPYHFTDAEVEAYPEDVQALFKACRKELVE